MNGSLRLVALALGIGVAGCGDEFGRPDGSPQSHIFNENYGAVYQRPAVTTEDRALSYWAHDIVRDYAGPHVKDAPSGLEAASLWLDCTLPRPSDEAQVAFVEIHAGYDDAPLFFVTDSDINRIRGAARNGRTRAELDHMLRSSAAGQIDVFVTEVQQPVYLVLSAHAETIWSLQIAEGARIDGISVIGHRSQALAHAPEEARIGFAVIGDSPQRDCLEPPHRPVTESWRALHKLDNKTVGDGFRRIIEDARENHDRFRYWLEVRFGIPDRSIAAYKTAHVLIGPKPATRLGYRRLAGTQLAFTPNATPVWGDRDAAADAVYRLAETTR